MIKTTFYKHLTKRNYAILNRIQHKKKQQPQGLGDDLAATVHLALQEDRLMFLVQEGRGEDTD